MTRPFPVLGVPGVLFHFLIELPVSKQFGPDHTPRSDMDLHCLPRSQKGTPG